MARLNKGILGGISGKIGTVVGVRLKGADIIRSLPTPSKKQATDAQDAHRNVFSAASRLLQPLNALVSAYFGSASGRLSRMNAAMSYTIREVMERRGDSPIIHYNKVLLTKGDLAGFQNLQLTAQNGVLHFSWEDNSAQGNANGADTFCMAAYCEAEKLWFTQEPGTRATKAADTTLPASFAGKDVHVYAFFHTESGDSASTSVYAGMVG